MQSVYISGVKAVKIETVLIPKSGTSFTKDKMYSVYLGNNYRVEFPSKRNALKFIAETNRFLSIKMHQVNALFSSTYAIYRTAWLYFKHNKANGYARTFKEKRCQDCIDLITDQLNRMVQKATENHNAFVWNYFNRSIKALIEILEICQELHQDRSNGAEAVQCQLLISQCKMVLTELIHYPSNIQLDIDIKVYKTALKIA